MITPRERPAARARSRGFRRALADSSAARRPAARDVFVFVPTRAAGEQLRRTLEERALATRRRPGLPLVGTRADLFDVLAARLPSRRAPVGVRARSDARRASPAMAPTRARRRRLSCGPGWSPRCWRSTTRSPAGSHGASGGGFHPNVELPEVEDRGAAATVQQTAFLAAVFRGYESRMASDDRFDEHALRARLIDAEPRVLCSVSSSPWRTASPIRTACGRPISICSRAFPGLLTSRLSSRRPRLQQVCSNGCRQPPRARRHPIAVPAGPRLIVPPPEAPAAEAVCFTYRDREEELGAIARSLKAGRHRALLHRHRDRRFSARSRICIWHGTSLPIRQSRSKRSTRFRSRPSRTPPPSISCFDAVSGDFTRATLLALLRSPHFRFCGGDSARRDRRLRFRAGRCAIPRRPRAARGTRVPLVRVAGAPATRDERAARPCRGPRSRP